MLFVNTGTALIDDINSAQVPHGQLAFWWLGQHSFIVKLGSTIIYIDPFLTNMPGRLIKPLLTPAEANNADLILGTHDHADHIDRPSLPAILAASSHAPLVIPDILRESVVNDLHLDTNRVVGTDAGRTLQLAGVTIHAIPASHELLDRDPATGRHPYLGFIIEGNGMCLYHAGDTCIYEGMQTILRRWKIDVGYIPINGRDAYRLSHNIIGNMTYQEAVDLAGSVGFGLTVPAHFEMFAGNSVDPELFVAYMRVKYPQLAFHVPVHGERVIVDSRGP